MRSQRVLICGAPARLTNPPRASDATSQARAISSSPLASQTEIQIASTLAGVLSRLILHPVDSVKTRLQHMRNTTTMIHPEKSFLNVIARERLPGLYRGIIGAVVGVIPYSIIYMPSYEFAQQTLTNYYGDKELLGIRHVLAGSIAGLCGSFVKVPVDVVKKRLQAGMYPNILIAISSIASDGIGGSHNKPWSSMRMFYSGWRSSILYDIPFNAVQFTVLENVKRCMRRYRRNETFLQSDHVVVGALTGLITSVITEPLDVIKTRMMTQRAASFQAPGMTIYRGWIHCMATIMKEEGITAFWKGTLPRLVWVGASSAIWYGTYQAAKQSMSARRRKLQYRIDETVDG